MRPSCEVTEEDISKGRRVCEKGAARDSVWLIRQFSYFWFSECFISLSLSFYEKKEKEKSPLPRAVFPRATHFKRVSSLDTIQFSINLIIHLSIKSHTLSMHLLSLVYLYINWYNYFNSFDLLFIFSRLSLFFLPKCFFLS